MSRLPSSTKGANDSLHEMSGGYLTKGRQIPLIHTRFDTVSLLIFSTAVPIYVPCRNCSGMPTSLRHRSIRMSARSGFAPSITSRIRGRKGVTDTVAHPGQELWQTFKAAIDPVSARDLRDQLILVYSPLVKYVAGRLASGLPNSVDSADLVSYGMFGLIDAIEKFEPERGLKFESYAMSRIRGAIVDELRSLDWVPRTLRAKAREIERAYQSLESRLHRAPTDSELSQALRVTVPQLHASLSRLAHSGVTTLDGILDDERSPLGDALADRSAGPGDRLVNEENRRDLQVAISGLPDRERKVLTLYYFEDLNMSDIGQVLGVSESRICQIHAKAVIHLRARLAAVNADPEPI